MNPHPTKSKPSKIGRKHTNQPSEKTKQKRRNASKNKLKIRGAKLKKFKAKVSDFWNGKTINYPIDNISP